MELWVILTLSSAVLFAFKDILAKNMFSKKNVKPNQLMFEEFFLLLIIILFLFFPRVEFSTFNNLWYLYLLKSIAIGGSALLYFRLLKEHDISNVAPLINLSPILLLIFSSFILSEQITSVQLFGIVVVIISTYFLEITMTHHDKKSPHKHHFQFLKKKNFSFFAISLIMLVFFSMGAITDKLIFNEGVNVYTNMFFTSAFILFILVIYYIKVKYIVHAFDCIVKEPETLLISIFTIVSSFLILFAIAIPTTMVSLIVPLRRTSTIFSSLIGGILFHENHLPKKILSTIGMLIGVFLIVF